MMDNYELQIRLEEMYSGLTLFADAIYEEIDAAGKKQSMYVDYMKSIMPALHLIRRNIWDLKEEVEKEIGEEYGKAAKG